MPIPFANQNTQAAPGTIGLPDDYLRVQADPAAFGSGTAAAVTKLGGALEQAGGVAMDIATRQQRLDDTVAANRAFAAFKNVVTAKSYGDPDDPNNPGFLTRQGSQAMTAYRPALDDLDAARTKFMNGLSPGAARQFDQSSQNLLGDTTATFDRHRAGAQQQYQAGSFDALATSSQSAAIAASGNNETFLHHLADGLNAVTNKGSLFGWSPEAISVARNEYVSATRKGVAQQMSLTNPQQAMAYVTANAVMGNATPGAVPAAQPGATAASTPAGGSGSQAIAPSGPPNPAATGPLGQPGPARPTSMAELLTFPGAAEAWSRATPQTQPPSRSG